MKFIAKILLLKFLILISILNIINTTKTSTATSTMSMSMSKITGMFFKNKNQNQNKNKKTLLTKNTNFLNLKAKEIENIKETSKEALNFLNKNTNFIKKIKKENQENYELKNNNNNFNNNFNIPDLNFSEIQEENLSSDTNFLYTGWQQISSKLFLNENLFPEINVKTPNGNFLPEKIKVDKDFFRINSNTNISPQTEKDFFFKMNEDKIYYSTDPVDVNILQVFHFENFNKISELPIFFYPDRTSISCFEIVEKKTKFKYKICNKNRKENLSLMCQIGKKLKIFLDSCENKSGDLQGREINTIIKQEVIDTTIVIPEASKFCNKNWTYENHGEDWECKCKEGNMQSPIDLPKFEEAIYSPIKPVFHFEEVSAKSPITTVDGEIEENGNIPIKYLNGAIRILHPNLGKIVTLNGAIYIAEEITVHTPSEHTKEGKRFDMEIQITFYGVSQGDIAKQVVLSFLFEKKAGFYNKFIDDLDFYTLPNQKDTEKFILNDLFIPKIFYSVNGENDPEDIISMKPFSFFTYEGSLTMPPCSEDTIHYVSSEIIPIGSVVLELAYEALKVPDQKKDDSNGQSSVIRDVSLNENYRNVQDKNLRNVFYFDHKKYCDPILESFNKPKGVIHYEKIPKKIITHIFVPGSKPSGIPGSFVESKKEAYGFANNINNEIKEDKSLKDIY